MKTLLISEIFPPQIGGTGRWFWEVYSRMPPDDVCVAAGEFAGATEFDRRHDLKTTRIPLAMSQWGLCSVKGLRAYWRLFWKLKRFVQDEGVQAIHAGRVLPEGWLALLLHKSCRLPFSVYVHGEELSYGDHSRELRWMMRRVFGRAKGVIVTTAQNTARMLRENWDLLDEKLTVLHPGVDIARFKPAECDSPAANRSPVVLTVGRLQKRKGQDMLIQALPAIREAFPDVLYMIVGDGEEKQALLQLVNEHGLQRNVEIHSKTTDDELVECYRNCDLFALPNREVDGDFEGFGIVLLEAQASGRPVLAGDSGGTVETMKPGKTGVIVDCTSPEPLAKAVIDLLSDDDRRERMGRAARRWVVDRFDWSAVAAQASESFGMNWLHTTESGAKVAV